MTLEELRTLRATRRRAMAGREGGSTAVEIIVGMGTSGIASGAKATLQAFRDEIEEQQLGGVSLRQTGSMGLDHAEPTVEVKAPGMPDVIYGKVDPETARKIVHKHVMGQVLLNDHIFDRPSPDIQK